MTLLEQIVAEYEANELPLIEVEEWDDYDAYHAGMIDYGLLVHLRETIGASASL